MKKYLITGLLVWIPLAITLWVLHLIVSSMDQVLTLLPPEIQPETLFGRQIPGLGLLLTVVVVFLTGVFTSNIIGQRLLRLWEGILRRIPVVNSIYNGVKQVSDTLFRPGGQAFRKALLVQWPQPGHVDDRVPHRPAGRRRRDPPVRRLRERLRSDDAQPDRRAIS